MVPSLALYCTIESAFAPCKLVRRRWLWVLESCMNKSKVDAANKLVPLSDRVVSECIGLLTFLHFDKEHPQHLYSICSYASMLEFAGDINVLAKNDRAT